MNTLINRIPTICGIAMIAMIAAAATHRLSINSLLTMAQDPATMSPTRDADQPSDPTQQLIAELRQQNNLLENALPADQQRQSAHSMNRLAAHTKNTSPEVRQILAELVEMNRELRNQVAETNRDLMELQFQVDTHSDQFRPLNVTNPVIESRDEPADSSAISVLPPID